MLLRGLQHLTTIALTNDLLRLQLIEDFKPVNKKAIEITDMKMRLNLWHVSGNLVAFYSTVM